MKMMLNFFPSPYISKFYFDPQTYPHKRSIIILTLQTIFPIILRVIHFISSFLDDNQLPLDTQYRCLRIFYVNYSKFR
jgi:hypothetical protein